MKSSRLILAHLAILAVVGGSFYDIATGQEHWPFSDYPMFSAVHREPVLNWVRLFGVTPEGREVAVLNYSELWPLDQSRLPLGIRNIYRRHGSGERLQQAVADALARYERRREAGQHEGPPLVAMRLYSVSWDLEPYGANQDRPRTRTLLMEVQANQGVRP
jgi:hypothetical protein